MEDGMTHIGDITDRDICRDMAREALDTSLTWITSLAYTTAPVTAQVPTEYLQETIPSEVVRL